LSSEIEQQQKGEFKMSTKRTLSSHALAAKQIREELKTTFSETKFSVTASCFAGGDSVHIDWTNGVTCKQVKSFVDKYQYGSFDGMNDIYEYTNNRTDISQVKYVQCQRDFTEELVLRYFTQFQATLDGWENLKTLDQTSEELLKQWSTWTARNYIYRHLNTVDLTKENLK